MVLIFEANEPDIPCIINLGHVCQNATGEPLENKTPCEILCEGL